MKIGNLTLATNLILPAMAGYSDIGQRALCSQFGAAVTFTEMVSAKGLCYNNENTLALLATSDSEKLKGVQLFGREPDIIAQAIQLTALAKFDIIDINMGCPMPKIYKNGEGSALMCEPYLVERIIKSAVAAAGGRPVTAKIRAGFSKEAQNGEEVALAIASGGGSCVTVHGRTREMLYSGKCDLEIIKRVKAAVNIPVIGNGDVTSRESYQRMLEYTGVDGVAIARASVGRPYIFSEVRGLAVDVDIKALIKEHIGYLASIMPERQVVNNMKKHIVGYYKGIRGSKQLKIDILTASTISQLLDSLV